MMRLEVAFPAEWVVDGAIARRDGLVVEVGPIELSQDPPAGEPRVTRDGWPMHVVETEARLCVRYTLLAHAATVVVRAPDSATLAAHREELLDVLAGARPEWRDRAAPICLADAWDLAPPSHYNRGQALALAGDHAAALAAFEAACAAAPDDVLARRKVIQCLYALGRDDEARAAREHLRAAWAASRDPRVTRADGYVFDQLIIDGVLVLARETLRAAPGPTQVLLELRAMRTPFEPLPVAVLVETSEPARAAGTPYVIAAVTGTTYRVVEARATLPSHRELARLAASLSG